MPIVSGPLAFRRTLQLTGQVVEADTATLDTDLSALTLAATGAVPETAGLSAMLGRMTGTATGYIIGFAEPSDNTMTLMAVTGGVQHESQQTSDLRDVLTTGTAHEEPS